MNFSPLLKKNRNRYFTRGSIYKNVDTLKNCCKYHFSCRAKMLGQVQIAVVGFILRHAQRHRYPVFSYSFLVYVLKKEQY